MHKKHFLFAPLPSLPEDALSPFVANLSPLPYPTEFLS
jgi:hypothetical protein